MTQVLEIKMGVSRKGRRQTVAVESGAAEKLDLHQKTEEAMQMLDIKTDVTKEDYPSFAVTDIKATGGIANTVMGRGVPAEGAGDKGVVGTESVVMILLIHQQCRHPKMVILFG